MEIYVVTAYDCRAGEAYLVGAYSTHENAFSAIKDVMAPCGQNNYIDSEHDWASGHWWFFYKGYTAEIYRTILDDNTDD